MTPVVPARAGKRKGSRVQCGTAAGRLIVVAVRFFGHRCVWLNRAFVRICGKSSG